MTRSIAPFLSVLALAGATCSSAAASTVSVERDEGGTATLVYRGGAGPDEASIDGYRNRFRVWDSSISPGRGCVKRSRRAVCRSAARIDRVVAFLGEGDDQVSVSASGDLRALLYAGPGDDNISRYSSAEPASGRLYGGEGDDLINGGEGHDVLVGGPGDDALDSGRGRDTVLGGEGVDVVHFGPPSGPSSDRVKVSLDGKGRDGVVGARDTVADVEGVASHALATLVGNASANLLVGSRYDDKLVGRGGLDTFDGNGGNDVIDARDGRLDFVGCGGGEDTAYVDRADDVSSECEHVRFRRPPRR